MKKIILIVAVAILGFTSSLSAQKYGHLNGQELLSSVPGYSASVTYLERFIKEQQTEVESMQADLKLKVAKFEQEASTLPKNIQEEQYKDLQINSQTVQEYARKAEKKIENKRVSLMNPLLKQINDAIKAVGKDNEFTYIFDTSQGVVVYFDGGTDVTPLVIAQLKKNKITEPKTK